MASIPQVGLFSRKGIEARSDLDRLRMVLSMIPDEGLMRELEAFRGKGRDDYPVRAVWNSLLAAVVYQHPSVASLRRELLRNGELLQLCGFGPLKGAEAVPPESAYTRFLKNLFRFPSEIEAIFDQLLERLGEMLPGLGTHLAVDSKAIPSAGKPSDKGADGRRGTEGNWGVKTYRGKRTDGAVWERVKRWFGYKLHWVVDATYKLPLAFEVTGASTSDTRRLLPMMKGLKDRLGWIVERSDDLAADKGYDSEGNNRELYDGYGIIPIIDIRQDWKDGEETRALYPDRVDNIVTDERGSVFCVRQSSRVHTRWKRLPWRFMGLRGIERA